MKRIFLIIASLTLSACAQNAYKLQISNNMADYHGQSIYYRSSLRSGYAGEIRRALGKKFGEMGMKTATATDNADLIGLFDIETFYKQNEVKHLNKNIMSEDSVLFSDNEDSESMYFSGNANMNVDHTQTCFTLNIGKKGTSHILYSSSFCTNEEVDAEQFMPYVIDIYSKYATYQSANVGVQCRVQTKNNEFNSAENSEITEDVAEADAETAENNIKVSCEPVNDSQQAFLNSLWLDNSIAE